MGHIQGDHVISTGITYDDDDCCGHKAEGAVLCNTLEGSVHEAASRHGNSGELIAASDTFSGQVNGLIKNT